MKKKREKFTSKLSSFCFSNHRANIWILNLKFVVLNQVVGSFAMGRNNDSDPVPAEKEDANKLSEKALPLPTVEESDDDDVEAGPMPPKALKRRISPK